MATNHKSTVTEAKKTEAKKAPVAIEAPAPEAPVAPAPAPAESVYQAEELAKAYKIFDASYELVMVALKIAGKKEATVTEAKAIIEEFMNKEVK